MRGWRSWCGLAATVCVAFSCGSSGEEPTPEPEVETPARPDEPEEVAEPEDDPREATEPDSTEPSVDLLTSVRAAVAVSSAYRDREGQALRLADGDLETAWNSRTGELVGAWIEVQEARDDADAAGEAAELVQALGDAWSDNPARTSQRIRTMERPEIPETTPEWEALRAQVDAARAQCGWGG